MNTKTLSIHFAGIVLAAFAFGGCIAPEDSDVEIDFDVDADAQDKGAAPTTQEEIDELDPGDPEIILGACYHGATTQVVAIDINAPRCDLTQLQDLYDWAEADGQVELKSFLTALDKKADIQCRPYYDVKGNQRWCADVIDRYADGSPLVKGTEFDETARNYFVAYAEDADGSAERAYWNQMLANPMWTNAPIELSETGFILKSGQFVPQYNNTSRGKRLLKFDPRECASCGYYNGPGMSYLTNYGVSDVSTGWWPPVTSSSCNIWTQQYGGQWAHMGSSTCEAEYVYRATSR